MSVRNPRKWTCSFPLPAPYLLVAFNHVPAAVSAIILFDSASRSSLASYSEYIYILTYLSRMAATAPDQTQTYSDTGELGSTHGTIGLWYSSDLSR